MDNVQKALKAAIKAIETGYELTSAKWECKAALSEIEKCYGGTTPVSEPVAYMYQHEETGNIGFIDQWQIDNGFEKNNPRLKVTTSLYTSPQPREWVELTNADLKDLALNTTNPDKWAKAIGAKLKQLNTKG